MQGADLSFVASEDIADKLFVEVHPDATDANLPRVHINVVDGGRVSGVSKGQDVLSGEHCSVTLMGYAKVFAGAAVPIGSYVSSDTAGKAVVGISGTDYIVGIALTRATQADDIIDIFIFHCCEAVGIS